MQKIFEKCKKFIPVISGVVLFLCAGLSVSLINPMKNNVRNENEKVNLIANEEVKPKIIEPEIKELKTENKKEIKTEIPVEVQKVQEIKSEPEIKEFEVEDENKNQWYVYVTGAVNNPGVYKLPERSRIFQAIEAAGGFNKFADQVYLNLAEELSDGTHIHILTKNETRRKNKINAPLPTKAPGVYIPENKVAEERIIEKNEERIVGKNNFIMSSVSTNSKNSNLSSSNKSKNSRNKKSESNEKVDVNHASIEELEKLKGVGPAIAKRIYEYRQANGSFKSVEELINVRGIGPAKLKNMRDQVIIR